MCAHDGGSFVPFHFVEGLVDWRVRHCVCSLGCVVLLFLFLLDHCRVIHSGTGEDSSMAIIDK